MLWTWAQAEIQSHWIIKVGKTTERSQNYTIGLEWTLRIMKLQPHCSRPPTSTLDARPGCPRPHPTWLGTPPGTGASITSLGSLFQHHTILLIRNFPLISNINFPSINLKPFLLVFVLIIWSNHQSITTTPTKPHLHVPWPPPGMVTAPPLWAACAISPFHHSFWENNWFWLWIIF